MKLAVTYENGEVYQHFGHTEQFKVYEVEDGKVVNAVVLNTNDAGHSALAGFLQSTGASALICGGIGGGARTMLGDMGILIYGGVTGDADAAVEAYLAGELVYDPNIKCAHHDHGEGHTCSPEGCGSHHCNH